MKTKIQVVELVPMFHAVIYTGELGWRAVTTASTQDETIVRLQRISGALTGLVDARAAKTLAETLNTSGAKPSSAGAVA
jgi:hypothetical protein